uniref:Thioredoxin reductase 1, cytoplasmic n=1 Tax=Oncorhynchus kisutch TaxID=8019 RepID=A0A8C7KFP5_ONCKI
MDQTRLPCGQYDYDLLVIGGGSGGLAVAKVVIIDFRCPPGLAGSSVNVGSIPRKLLHQASPLGKAIQDMFVLLRVHMFCCYVLLWSVVSHGWGEMVEVVQQHVKSVSFELRRELRDSDVTYLNAHGEILVPHIVQVRPITQPAETLVIAVGDRKQYLIIPGDREHCITRLALMTCSLCPHSPGRTLIVGGSSEGLECAGFLFGLGLEVTVLVRSHLVPGFDHKRVQKIENHMLVHGVEQIEAGSLKVTAVSTVGRETLICWGFTSTYLVLLAVGRDTCTSDIGIDHVGVKYNQETGKISVNEKEQSSVGYVYAMWAVQEGRSLTTALSMQAGRLLAHRLYGGHSTTVRRQGLGNVPTVMFPPMEYYSTCGLSEENAILKFGEDNVEVHIGRYLEGTRCYAKVICHIPDYIIENVVGLHVMGPSAGEVFQGFAVALRCGLIKQQLDTTVRLHPVCAQVSTPVSLPLHCNN